MDILGFAYAAVVAGGGVYGYVKAGSTISMVMGLLFGGMSAFGAYQITQEPKNVTVLLVTSSALFAVMGYRFLNSGKFMPSGLMTALSLLTILRLLPKLIS
ncbi:hypothetical protein LSH36_657g01039 [Paralvinella palmiformis]|uniref:Transmembrane protein 14C n=1 Tax=Paralvinella palmiformis TaxID=53620 RepID=A0AAD9MU13_9ANNE|nr:hypothetical protein LSH36_657g01039 [Paralvinella palmiformis]